MQKHFNDRSQGWARVLLSLSLIFVLVNCSPGDDAAQAKRGMKGKPGDHHYKFNKLAKDDKFLTAGSLAYKAPCPDTSKCGGKSIVNLVIAPEEESNSLGWQSSIEGKADGNFVASVVNEDDVTYGPWQLEPGEKLFLWVGEDDASRPALYRIPKYNPWGTPVNVFTFDDWIHCPGDPKPPEVHEQPFKCESAMGPGPGGVGLWMSCSLGCCQVRTT